MSFGYEDVPQGQLINLVCFFTMHVNEMKFMFIVSLSTCLKDVNKKGKTVTHFDTESLCPLLKTTLPESSHLPPHPSSSFLWILGHISLDNGWKKPEVRNFLEA